MNYCYRTYYTFDLCNRYLSIENILSLHAVLNIEVSGTFGPEHVCA